MGDEEFTLLLYGNIDSTKRINTSGDMNYMKKEIDIGILDIVQLFLVITLVISVIFFIAYKLNLNVLALIIAATSLAVTILNEISKNIERKRETKVKRIQAREYDEGLFDDIEQYINELRNNRKIVDSIYVIDACGYNDHRKEAMIVFH